MREHALEDPVKKSGQQMLPPELAVEFLDMHCSENKFVLD